MKFNKYLILICMTILLIITSACTEEAIGGEEDEVRAIPVDVIQVEKGSLTDNLTITGHIVAQNHLPVISVLSGEVVKLHVKNGDIVSRGDVLVELDQKDMQLNVQQANAGLQAAEANLQNAKNMRSSNIKQAELQLEQAEDTYEKIKEAEKEAEEEQSVELPVEELPEELMLLVQSLMGMNMGTGMDVDQAKRSVDAAKLALEQAQSTSSIEAAEASVEQAKIALQMAEQQISNVQIKAPISGQVVGLNTLEGGLVTPQAPLMQIVELDSLIVKTNINENQLALVQLDQEVELKIRAINQELNGRVEYISPIPAEQSRSYPTEISLSNINEQIKVGLTTEIILDVTDNLEHLLIPYTAYRQDQGEDIVFVALENNLVERRVITIIGESAEWIAIEGGINEGDSIVTRGVHQLTDGALISVQNGGE